MDNEFFITGGTLPPNAHSYINRRADTELLDSLLRGEFCYVLNTRQMGKSSLMSRAAHRLREQGIAVVVLDLTAIGQNLTVEQWYAGLLGRMVQQTGLRDDMLDFWRNHRELGPMQRFLEMLRSVLLTPSKESGASEETPSMPDTAASLLKLVIFIDEIDVVRSLPFSADEFFAGIRECYNRRAQDPVFNRLTFCLLGVAAPSDLIQDTRISPFNIGRRIELEDFTPEEARPLAGGLLPPGPQTPRNSLVHRLAQRLLKRVLYWTNGHPYMTQRLCREIVLQQGSVQVGDVDRLCERLFFTRTAQASDDNLAFVRNRLLKSEADLPALLDLYSQILAGKRVRDEDSNPLCSLLRLSGAVSVERGLLKPRNRIYRRVFNREWVRRRMPDAELRRQERAYRQGIMRTASIATSMLVIISGLAINAYVAEKHATVAAQKADKATATAKAETGKANSLVYAAQMREVQKAYEANDLMRACNLLEKTKDYPGKGFEWNYWNRLTHQELFTVKAPSPRSLTAYSRDGKWIVTQTKSVQETPHLDLWDAQDGHYIRTLPGRTSVLQGVGSPVAADLVAVVNAPEGVAGPVLLIDPRTGLILHTLRGTATAATLSGDGKRVFTLENGDSTHTVLKIWDAHQGTLLFTDRLNGLQTFGQWILEATIQSTSDSRLLAFGPAFNRGPSPITLLDTTTNARPLPPTGLFTIYSLSAQGRCLACAHDLYRGLQGPTELWDLHSHRKIPLGGTRSKYAVTNFQFSPDESLLAGSGGDWGHPGQVWLWDTKTGEERRTMSVQQEIVNNAWFSPDGKSLFTWSSDSSMQQWNLATGARSSDHYLTELNLPAMSPDSTRILIGDSDMLRAYTFATQKMEAAQIIPHSSWFGFCSDSRHIACSTIWTKLPANGLWVSENIGVAIHRTDSRREAIHKVGDLNRLDFSRDGWQVATALAKPQNGVAVEVRDMRTYRVLAALPCAQPCERVLFSTDGALLTTLAGNQVQLWDTRTWREVAHLPSPNYKIRIASAVQRGRKVVCEGDDNKAHVRDAQTGQELYAALPLGSPNLSNMYAIAETPDGNALCTFITDGFGATQIAVYDMNTGVVRFRRGNAVGIMCSTLLSHDSRFLAWGDVEQNVHITELTSGRDVNVLHSIGGYLIEPAWSPDGKRLVTSALGGVCKLWDTNSGEELMTFPKPSGSGITVGFSPDGTCVAIAIRPSAHDYSLCLWNSHAP